MYFLIVKVAGKTRIYTNHYSKETLIKQIRRGVYPKGKIVKG